MSDQFNTTLAGLGALLAGGGLGAIFFGGLWWTVRRAASSPAPLRWFLGSLLLRTVIVLAGFYFIGAGRPALLGLCLLGFLLARVGVLRATKPSVAGSLVSSGTPPCA
jgi:F1F0 ATPase subunit 2